MTVKYANNASSTLVGSLTNSATSLSVASGEGSKFPAISGGDYFMATLEKIVGGVATREIIKVTAISGDALTIVRGQEGTTATTFSGGDRIENRITADPLNNLFAKKDVANTFTQPQSNASAPTAPEHYANKSYVDSRASSLASIHAAILSL
jgi:hypothetical protein